MTMTALFSENQVSNLVKTSVLVPHAVSRMCAVYQNAATETESGCQNNMIYIIHSSWRENIQNSKRSTRSMILKTFLASFIFKKMLISPQT